METLILVENRLRDGSLTNNPHECAELRAKLAGEYSFWMGQIAEIETKKPAMWNVRRKDFKSDTACDKWWEATDDGINEVGMKITVKRLEKMMQGLNGLLKIAEGESKNIY